MEGFLVEVVVAFLIFTVALPLFGFLVGGFCYYVLPYLFGGVAVMALGLIAGGEIILAWWVWLATAAWASAVHFVRRRLMALGYEIEHHRAAHFAFLGGAPYRRLRSRLEGEMA